LLGSAAAQYTIDWYTVDGGGGTSTSAVYEVKGTTGQLDAGEVMTGGPFALSGGFWSVYAVQVPGAPVLHIIASGPNEVTVSWEPGDSDWVLQAAGILEYDMLWTNAPSGPTNPVVIPVTQPTHYYRLARP
jgi:hypothetical protein